VCCPSLSWGSFLESWSQHLCHHLQVWTRALDFASYQIDDKYKNGFERQIT